MTGAAPRTRVRSRQMLVARMVRSGEGGYLFAPQR